MPTRTYHPARAKRPAQIIALLLALVLAIGAGGVAMAGLAMPAVLAASSTTAAGTSLFDDLPDEIEIDTPSQRSVMLAADGSKIASFYADNRIVVPLDQISENIQHAVVSIEDRRFFDHKGIDPEGIARAFVNNAVQGDTEGASTLTQQYVKNALIERARVAGDDQAVYDAKVQDYGRKLREAKLAITLEKHSSKEDILAGYLNIAPFGASVYGVEAASLHYFSKHASELSVSEAALIAGTTQSPIRFDPTRNPEQAQKRRSMVLAAMERDGHITADERKEAESVSVEDLLHVQDMRQGCSTAGNAAYFCEYVTQVILNDEHFGKDREDRRRLLFRGGLTIKTTLDPKKQEAAFDSAVNAVPIDDSSGIDITINSIEPGTGKILAMTQNSKYGDPSKDNKRAKKINLSVDRAHGGGDGFQTGSTAKIFALTQWLRSGRHLSDHVYTNRGKYTTDDFNISCRPDYVLAKPWEPKNMELGPGGRTMSVKDATKYSVNRPFVDMETKLDLCDVVKTANDLGALERGNGDPLVPDPAMVLGTNPLTPLTMANVGATLAAGGKRCTPIALTEVTDSSGNTIEVPPVSCEQTIEPNVANTVVYAMQQVVSKDGTGKRAVMEGRPVAGKTGTANNNYQAWFLGFVPQLSTSVWMGYADADKSMSYQRVNGQWVNQLFGGLIPAPTWKSYMEKATKGMDVEEFPKPDASLVKGTQKKDEIPSGYYPRRETSSRSEREPSASPSTSAATTSVPSVVGYTVADATTVLKRAGFSVSVGSARPSKWEDGVVMAQSSGSAEKGATITIYPSSGPQ